MRRLSSAIAMSRSQTKKEREREEEQEEDQEEDQEEEQEEEVEEAEMEEQGKEEKEKEKEVDSRMTARPSQKKRSLKPMAGKRDGGGDWSGSGARKRGTATGAAAHRQSNGKRVRLLRLQREEEYKDEVEDGEGGYVPPSSPLGVSALRRVGQSPCAAEEEQDQDHEEEDDGHDLDPRFYHTNLLRSPASAPMEEERTREGDEMDVDEVDGRFYNAPRAAPAAPSSAVVGVHNPPRHLSWSAPSFRFPSFLRPESAALPPSESPSKRVAFREQLGERWPEHMQELPSLSSRRASAAAASASCSSSYYSNSSSSSPAMRHSSRFSGTPHPVIPPWQSPVPRPARGLMKKATPVEGREVIEESGRSVSDRMSFTSLLHRREAGARINNGTQPRRRQDEQSQQQQQQQQQQQHKYQQLHQPHQLLPGWPSMLMKDEVFSSGMRRLKIFSLGLTLLSFWLLCLGGVLKVGLALWVRKECPPGHVRGDILGLWGECVVPQSTVIKLVKSVQRRTVEDLCKDPRAAAGAEGVGSWIGKQMTVNVPPRYREEELWGDISMHSYPWGDLALRGVDREWRGPDLATDYYVHLRGRPEVMGALWRQGAVLCRIKVFLYEMWNVLAALSVLSGLVLSAFLKARAEIRQRQQVDKVKRMIVNILIAEGEIAIDLAKADLLHGLDRDYRELCLTKSRLKILWPAVVRAVERDPRVSTAPREMKGRAMPHWVWLSKRLPKRIRYEEECGGLEGGEVGSDVGKGGRGGVEGRIGGGGGEGGGGGGGGRRDKGWLLRHENKRNEAGGDRRGGGRYESVRAVVI